MQTVSQQLAARRAAKAALKADKIANGKKIKGLPRLTRNDKSAIAVTQKANIRAIFASKPISENEYLNQIIKLWMSFHEMRHKCDADTILTMQHALRQYYFLGVLSGINLTIELKEADDAIGKWIDDFDELSPNQRDIVLKPLHSLIHAIDEDYQNLPIEVFKVIGKYAACILVIKKNLGFISQRKGELNAFYETINGADSRKTAKKYGIPYAAYTEQMLYAANKLYDIALLSGLADDTKRPERIPEIRQTLFQTLCADKGRILTAIESEARATAKQIESDFGVSIFDWQTHAKQLIEIVKQIEKEQ